MATITTDQFLDGGTSRTAGEAWTLNGGKLTIRTDTRWHANAPASMTGSLAATTISAVFGGGVFVEGRNVRWMAYNTGTGNVPAIGTTVTQGGVSGYLLGVWASVNSAPTAVAAAMPASGFIKFREVTGGPFAAGALTGIGASATAADVTGWIEYVQDQSTGITISRKGSGHVARGDWFYLADTNGSQGQVIEFPANGGGVGSYLPGVWIETAVASGMYEFWPELTSSSANGWAAGHIGQATPDVRHKYVRGLGSGTIAIGQAFNTAVTYTGIASAITYTWANNIVTVTLAAHGYSKGEQVYIDATSGTLPDGTYTIETVTGGSTFTIYLAGSGTSGGGNMYGRCTVALTAHGLYVGQTVKLTPSTGSLITGEYEIISSADANSYVVACAGIVGTGNATQQMNLGLVPPSGCKVRIGNILMRQCTTGARASNARPHATIGSRPVFTTTGAGVVDHENVMSDWYYNFSQPYQVRLRNLATYDAMSIGECATALDLFNVGLGMNQSLDIVPLTLTSCFAGGTIENAKFMRGNLPGANDHAISLSLCAGQSFTNVTAGLIQNARSSGAGFSISQCRQLTLDGCRQINSNGSPIVTCSDIVITDFDHVDRQTGVTTAVGTTSVFTLTAKCNNIRIDGVTEGFGGTIARQHAYNAVLTTTACDNVTLRNYGTAAAPMGADMCLNAMGVIAALAGNNSSIKIQRCYRKHVRTGLITDANSDKNATYESVVAPFLSTGLQFTYTVAALNAVVRGCKASIIATAANASVYGTHLMDLFTYNVRQLSTYTWAANVLTVSFTAHGYAPGDKVWIEFNTGGGTPSGVYTVYSTLTNSFTVVLTGSGTAGQCNTYRWVTSLTNLYTVQGRIQVPMNEPTVETLAYAEITGTAAFTSVPSLTIPAVNDEVVFESQHTIKGHTAFSHSPPVLTGVPAVQVIAYTHAAGVITCTLAAHGLLAGDLIYLDNTTGTLPKNLYTVATVTSTSVFTITLAGSSTAGNANGWRLLWVRYKIDTGSGYGGSYRNVFHQQPGGVATAGSAVVTMISTADVAVGDSVWGLGLGVEAKVLTIDSATQLTLTVNSIVTGANLVFTFSNLVNETIDSADGFRLKLSVTSRSPGSGIVVTYLTIPTVTSAADQALALYPLDTTTITFTGLPTGTDVVVLTAGTETVLSQVDAWPSASYPYTYEGSPTVDVGFIKPGFVPQYIRNLPLTLLASSIPVTLTPDRNYS